MIRLAIRIAISLVLLLATACSDDSGTKTLLDGGDGSIGDGATQDVSGPDGSDALPTGCDRTGFDTRSQSAIAFSAGDLYYTASTLSSSGDPNTEPHNELQMGFCDSRPQPDRSTSC